MPKKISYLLHTYIYKLMPFLLTPLHKQYMCRYLLCCGCTLPLLQRLYRGKGKLCRFHCFLIRNQDQYHTLNIEGRYFFEIFHYNYLGRNSIHATYASSVNRSCVSYLPRNSRERSLPWADIQSYSFHFSTEYCPCKFVPNFYMSNYLFQLEKEEGMYVSDVQWTM